MDYAFISEVNSADTGGGMLIDLVVLADGRVIGISADAIVLYESMTDFEENEGRERPLIPL